jgi:hypothetical protein
MSVLFSADGGPVRIPPHPPSSLGGVPVQVLPWVRLPIPPLLFQAGLHHFRGIYRTKNVSKAAMRSISEEY